jgi:hypothetical protein
MRLSACLTIQHAIYICNRGVLLLMKETLEYERVAVTWVHTKRIY